jgi:hypothetical protein
MEKARVHGTNACAGEKQCAHPPSTCFAEAGKEFCSDECRTARTEGSACVCNHPGCQTTK